MALQLCMYQGIKYACYFIRDTATNTHTRSHDTILLAISYFTDPSCYFEFTNEDPESDIVLIDNFDPSVDYTLTHPELFI